MSEKAYLLGSHEDENGQDAPEDTTDSTVAAGQNDGEADSKKKSTATAGDKSNGET